jgi:hypothetical protein
MKMNVMLTPLVWIYTRYAGWLDGLWLGFFDARGTQCPPSDKLGDLLTAVLIPTNKQ